MGRIIDDGLFGLIHDYLKIYLPNQRNASPNTLKAYRETLRQLLDYAMQKHSLPLTSVTFEILSPETISEFLEWLTMEKNCSVNTRNQRLACIRAFFSYAAACAPEHIARKMALAKIPHQKHDKYSGVEYMSETAIQCLLRQPAAFTKSGIRDQFLMILMCDTGARIQEVLDLRVCDIHVGATSTATLIGKGSKIRTVPMMPETVEHFKNYLSLFHPECNEYSKDSLFYIERKGIRSKMSDDTVRHFLKRYGATARKMCHEVPENIHPHLFRHSRAMHLYQHGMDLTLISQWLGHVNLETTLVYAHADTEQKRRAIEKSMGVDVTGGVAIPHYSISDEETLKRLYGLL